MTVDELKKGVEYTLDGELFRVVFDPDRPSSHDMAAVIVFYFSKWGTFRQESWVNPNIDDERLIRFFCIDTRRLANRKAVDEGKTEMI